MKASVSVSEIIQDFLQKEIDPARKEDLKIIEKFIGRTPSDIISITRRCWAGFPQVFLSSPLISGKPFPTLFWLCCPYLVKEVSKLEARKVQERIRDLLEKDSKLKGEMEKANSRFRQFRKSLKEALGVRLPEKALKASISGSIHTWSLKCLHVYLAAELSGFSTPVGRILKQELTGEECIKPCIPIEGNQ